MHYTLVKPDGTLGQTRDFDIAPTLAPNKGKWLPDNPPAYDPLTHSRVRSASQSVNNSEIVYLVTPLDPQIIADREAAEAKRAEIAQAKANARADNFVQQFVNMTPAQLIAYVNANVSNLADAKQLLTKLALMMLAIAKEQYK